MDRRRRRGPPAGGPTSRSGTDTVENSAPTPALQPRFVVLCRRHDGREREWRRYTDRAEAEQIARKLTSIGCPSRVATDDELALEGGAA